MTKTRNRYIFLYNPCLLLLKDKLRHINFKSFFEQNSILNSNWATPTREVAQNASPIGSLGETFRETGGCKARKLLIGDSLKAQLPVVIGCP